MSDSADAASSQPNSAPQAAALDEDEDLVVAGGDAFLAELSHLSVEELEVRVQTLERRFYEEVEAAHATLRETGMGVLHYGESPYFSDTTNEIPSVLCSPGDEYLVTRVTRSEYPEVFVHRDQVNIAESYLETLKSVGRLNQSDSR